MRALMAAAGLAAVCGAAHAQAVQATPGEIAGASMDMPMKVSIADLMADSDAGERLVSRFGLRMPVLPGTVCTFEDEANRYGPWDLSDTGGFIFNAGTFPIADNFAIDDQGGTLADAVINTICTEGLYNSGGAFVGGGLGFADQWEVSYWGVDGDSLPDVFEIVDLSPASGLQPFIQGTNLTATETENQNFGARSSIFELSHADVTFETETCYSVQIQNNFAAVMSVPIFLVTGSDTLGDGAALQDTNNSLDFTRDENIGGDLALALYDSTGDNWDLDTFIVSTNGGPSDALGTGEGICNFVDVVPETPNGFCDDAEALTLGTSVAFDMDIPGTSATAFARAGTYVLDCPIGTLGVNTGITGNFGLFYTFVGDGNTVTISTCASASSQDTILQVYAESDPANPCEVLYCISADNDGCGLAAGPAELSLCTVAGETYVVVVQSAGLTEGFIVANTDSAACDTFGDIDATRTALIQASEGGTPEGETCAQGDGGNGINDGCGGVNATSADAEMIAIGDVRTGTSSNIQSPIIDRGPDVNGFGPNTADAQDAALIDQDYYNIMITEPGILSFGGYAEFPFELQVFQYSAIDPAAMPDPLTGCEALANVAQGDFERETFGNISAFISTPGLYACQIAHSNGSPYIYTCADGEVDYAIAVDFTSATDVEIDPGDFMMVVQEPDACGVNQPGDTNQGCAADTPVAGPTLLSGQTYYGEVAAENTLFGTFRDIDTFNFDVPVGGGLVTLAVTSELPWVANLIENQSALCGDNLAAPGAGAGSTTLSYFLPEGNYQFLFTEASFDTNFTCAAGFTEYAVSLDVAAFPSFSPMGSDVVEMEDYCAGIPYATVPNDANSGCTAVVAGTTAGTIGVGESGQGTASTTIAVDDSSIRDVDAWTLDIPAAGDYELTVETDVAVIFFVEDETDCFEQLAIVPNFDESVGGIGGFIAFPGAPATVAFSAPAGSFTLTIFPAFFGLGDEAVLGSCPDYQISLDPVAAACPPDITVDGACTPGVGDGLTTLSDFSCFLAQWAAMAPIADVTLDGTCDFGNGGDGVTLSDFSCYLATWSGGCDGDPGTPL
ncbi:MAG: GC-type dockerin domain-anchored protein [Planctomycetota bacterium]